jgi:hypothetical protein
MVGQKPQNYTKSSSFMVLNLCQLQIWFLYIFYSQSDVNNTPVFPLHTVGHLNIQQLGKPMQIFLYSLCARTIGLHHT